LIAWRLGDIDPRFQLTQDEAKAHIRAATALWEKAAHRKLFVEDEISGFPVQWIFDGRQERINSISADRGKLAKLDGEIESAREDLESAKSEVDRHYQDIQSRRELAEAKLNGYNARISEWNAHGGAPEGVRDQLDQERKDIEAERTAINADVDALNEEQRELQHKVDSLNSKVMARNKMLLDLKLEEGQFFEKVGVCHGQGNRIIGIDVYAFATKNELSRTLTHEFGHALFLKHVPSKDSLMNAAAQGPAQDQITLSSQDLAELRRALKTR
jgi:DNA repair exonuclease SbcCD ATPase subunit